MVNSLTSQSDLASETTPLPAVQTNPVSAPVVVGAWGIAIGLHVVALMLAYNYVIPFSTTADAADQTVRIELVGDPFATGSGTSTPTSQTAESRLPSSASADPLGDSQTAPAPPPAAMVPVEGVGAGERGGGGSGGSTSGPSIVSAPAGTVDVPNLGIGSGGDGSGEGPGIGDGGSFFGAKATVGKGDGVRGARRIIYVVDRSGSMMETFQHLRNELKRSISALKRSQRFHVIFFAAGSPVENPPQKCVAAIEANKEEFFNFLDQVRPGGSTHPEEAMRKAIELEPELIYLLTDGLFDVSLLTKLREWNRDAHVKISTIAYVSDEGRPVLEQIAREHEGEFKFISEHDLP